VVDRGGGGGRQARRRPRAAARGVSSWGRRRPGAMTRVARGDDGRTRHCREPGAGMAGGSGGDCGGRRWLWGRRRRQPGAAAPRGRRQPEELEAGDEGSGGRRQPLRGGQRGAAAAAAGAAAGIHAARVAPVQQRRPALCPAGGTCDTEMWFQHCERCDDAQLAGTS